MVQPTCPPANGFVASMRKLYNPLGFAKGYNFVLWFIACGYILGFTLARLEYLSFDGIFCVAGDPAASRAAPGECYYYFREPYKIGIQLHLYTILPAGLLVVLQFVPVIRHTVILFHRINGYLVILLSLVSSAGTIIVAPHAFGGDMATRTWVGVTVIATTLAYLFAWINIKRLQIDQHRAWMLRAWAYFSCIITIRLIFFTSSTIISKIGGFWTTWPCPKIASVIGPKGTLALYPNCAPYFNGSDPGLVVPVEADWMGTSNPIGLGAALDITFGAAGWLALALHVVIIEVYLRLTPAENQRLREVSYERQLERGMKHPGSAGLVAQRLGDANPYMPVSKTRNMSNEERGKSDEL